MIPHACFDKTEVKDEIIDKVRAEIGYYSSDTIIIGLFGFVNDNKRPEIVIEAAKKLGDMGYNVKVVFWGKLWDERMLGVYREEVDWHATGFIDKDEYEAGFILSDIIINLRYPSMGESSGTLCEAMKYNKPVIVSDINQYTEFPDDVCWKVMPDQMEVDILKEYIIYLIEHKKVRDTLSANAEEYADNELNPAGVAKLYYHVLK